MFARALVIGAALLLWPACALPALPAPASDALPAGFVRDHKLPDTPAIAEQFFGYDIGEWARGQEYLGIVARNVERSLLADRDLRVRILLAHHEPVTRMRAGRICGGRIDTWELVGAPLATKTSVTIMAHIDGLAYVVAYVYPIDHPSPDASDFVKNFCGYSANQRKRIEPRLTNQPQ